MLPPSLEYLTSCLLPEESRKTGEPEDKSSGPPVLQSSSFLPPIGAIENHRPPAIVDVTNPGATHPSRQQWSRAVLDQTMTITRTPGGVATSDGQVQRVDLNPGNRGVTVTEVLGQGPPATSNGQRQWKDHSPLNQGVLAEAKATITMDVRPADSQHINKNTKTIAETMPPAVTYDGGKGRPGGLPKHVLIK